MYKYKNFQEREHSNIGEINLIEGSNGSQWHSFARFIRKNLLQFSFFTIPA